MAVSQDKIKERLRALFPKANLSKQRLDAIAAKLATKPEDEATDDQVDEVISDYNEVIDFEQIARDDDRIRTLEAARKPKPTKPAEQRDEDSDDPDDGNETNKLLKSLLEKVEKLESEKAQETVSQKFIKLAKEKNIPEAMYKRAIPSKEDDIDVVLAEIEADWKDFAEKNKLQNYGKDQPGGGRPNGNPGKIKPKTLEDVKDLAKTI